jgi:hypothetical protein
VILSKGAVTPTLDARYRADLVRFHVLQPTRTGASHPSLVMTTGASSAARRLLSVALHKTAMP